jgi:hypothetical protein
LLNPTDVFPDGMFEKDIVLSKSQAYNIFSKHFSNVSSEEYQSTIQNIVQKWPLPIYFGFDQTHGKI